MPAKNSRKIYLPNTTYHIFNRGAFKMEIFKEKADYEYFYTLLWQEQRMKNIVINVESILPNHFHLQFFQKAERDIQHFMRSLGTRYALYFCKKYDHSGYVFQGNYKALPKRGLKEIRENTEYILNNPQKAGIEPWPYVGRFSKWRENYL